MTGPAWPRAAGDRVRDDGPSPTVSRRAVLQAGAGAVASGIGLATTARVKAGGIPTPWLHRDGNLIRDPQGNRVLLRGVNIPDVKRLNADNYYGLSAADYITWATNGASPPGTDGPGWYARVIRLPVQPVDIGGHSPGGVAPVPAFDRDQLEAYIENHLRPAVDLCAQRGVYCIVDYHRHRGRNDERYWFTSDPIDAELRLFWNTVAPAFADDPHVLFEVYNEPIEPFPSDADPAADSQAAREGWARWKEAAQPWVDIIREHASRNLILIGSPRWSQWTAQAPNNEFDGENLAYTGHVYGQENLKPFSRYFGEPSREVPVFLTEWGYKADRAPHLAGTTDEEGQMYLDLFAEYPIHPVPWIFDFRWTPQFFEREGREDWSLLDGNATHGGLVRQLLYDHRNDDLPGGGGPTTTRSTTGKQPTRTETDEAAKHAADGATPRLRREGNRLVDPAGDPVTLRGLNIADPKRIDVTAPARGKTAVQVIDAVTDRAAGWYPRAIRVPVQPVDIGEYEPGSGPPVPAFDRSQLETYLEAHLDAVVERCGERGVYCIVDYHRHRDVRWAEGQTGPVNADLQAEVETFWDVVAPRYADRSHVIYEVYNEPTQPGMWGDPTEQQWVADIWRTWLEMAQPWVDTIRSHAENLVLMGSPGWTQSPEGALVEEFDGDDIAYTYHIYPGHTSSQHGDWEDASSANNGEGVAGVYEQVPLVVTEWGWEEGAGRYIGGTDDGFGEPFHEWLEHDDAIHWTAWCGDPVWRPRIFERPFGEDVADSIGNPYGGSVPTACSKGPCEWSLRSGAGGMGEDVKRWLAAHSDSVPTPPGERATPTTAAATTQSPPDRSAVTTSRQDTAATTDEPTTADGPGFGPLAGLAGLGGLAGLARYLAGEEE